MRWAQSRRRFLNARQGTNHSAVRHQDVVEGVTLLPKDPSSERDTVAGEDAKTTLGTAIRAVDRIEVHVWLDSVPVAVAAAVESLAHPAPPSRIRIFFKDYLPVVTPIAAIIVTVAVSYTTCQFNKRASEIAQKAATNSSTEAYGKIIAEVGLEQDDAKKTAAAMKLAAYGDQPLPAVKMALGVDVPSIRAGGVLVAKEMYLANTVERSKLTEQLLHYLESDNPVLRRGVLEWLVGMGLQLSKNDSRLAFAELQHTFGLQGNKCAQQDEAIQVLAANFLSYWAFSDSTDLVFAMAKNCTGEGARNRSVNTLPKIADKLLPSERLPILNDLVSLQQLASPELRVRIDQATQAIENIPERRLEERARSTEPGDDSGSLCAL